MKGKRLLGTALMAQLMALVMGMTAMATTDYEAKAKEMLAPLDFFKYLIIGAVEFGGVIMLIFGVYTIAKALPSHDNSTVNNGVMWCVGGILCVAAGAIVGILVQ